jgi:hypothetical protein
MEGLNNLEIKWGSKDDMDNSELSLAYIAGLFDGEGCISIDKASKQGKDHPRFQLHTTIHLREGDVLKQIQKIFGGSLRPNKIRNPNHALTWRWRLSSKKAMYFLKCIYPFLCFKRKQAYFGLHFQQLMTDCGGARTENEALIQEDHYWLMRDINRRGVTRWTG